MDENVNFVSKEINPPNVPQARPELFGTKSLPSLQKEAKTEQHLIRRIESKMEEYDANFVF